MTQVTREQDESPEKPVLKLVLQQNRQAPARARAAVAAFCDEHGVDEETLQALRLLVSELVTNAVVHADVDPSANVELFARLEPELVRIEVLDQGSGFVPRPAPADHMPASSGYGLFLLERQADRWGVDRTTGSRVWFELAR
jgi:anti-sigma regulatory factor (Ser/Thr protein kinase)